MTIAGVKFPQGLNEISMALMKHGQFLEEENKGLIPNFTGIDSPFEPPKQPDIIIKTKVEPLEISLKNILELIGPKLELE